VIVLHPILSKGFAVRDASESEVEHAHPRDRPHFFRLRIGPAAGHQPASLHF
jgi:hypothetical protein